MIGFYILWITVLFSSVFVLSKRFQFASVFLFFFIFAYFIGLRPVTLGTDTQTYTYLFQEWTPSFFDSGLEVIFSWITSIFKILRFDSTEWIFSLASIYLLLMFIAVCKIYKNHLDVFLLLFASLFFWLFSINIIRYGLAFSVFIFSCSIFTAHRGKRTLSLLVCLVVAMGFHITILIQSLCLVFYSRKITGALFKYCFIFMFVAISILILDMDMISFLGWLVGFLHGYLPDRFISRFYFYLNDYGQNEINLGFSYALSFFIVGLSAYFRSAIRSKVSDNRYFFFELSFYFSFFNVIVLPLVYKYDTFSRVLSGFEFFSIFLMYELIALFLKRFLHRYIFIVFVSSLFFLKIVHVGFVNGFLSNRF